MGAIILNPMIPYVGPIGGDRFYPNKLVKLEGTVPPYAHGFNINLQCGPNTFPQDDIALQISVRFLNEYISLNSSQQNIWGKERRLLNVPIMANQKFKITVLCEFNQYKVFINDEHYCVFPQRIHCEKVSHLSIDGDISIIRISYKSICDAKSNTTTPLNQSKIQCNHVQHSNLPPSYDTAMNYNNDAELQNNSQKAISNRGCKIFFVFLCVIAGYTVCGFIMYYFIIQHGGNDTEFRRNSYSTPSVDFKSINLDMNKHNKEISDAMEEMKKMDEQRQEVNDVIAKSNQMIEDSKSYFDIVEAYNQRARDKKVTDELEKAKKLDEANKFVSGLLQIRSNLKT